MSNEKPKRPEDVTEENVKQVAITRAAEEGWTVDLDDCRVQKIPSKPIVTDEIGLGRTITNPGILNWIVSITPKAPPNKSVVPLIVTVEFSFGSLDAENFYDPKHSR